MTKIKTRRCKICNEKYEVNPNRPLFPACSFEHGIEYVKLLKKNKQAKEWKDKKRSMKEKLKTHKDYLNDLQVVFNTFIRLRDREQLCICCDKPIIGKYDAGHFYSVKSSSALRFDEDNVHAQRVHCNRDLHGNLIEYGIMLPFRIGYQRFKALEQKSHDTVKLSIPEIKDKIIHYKNLIKELT